MQVGDKVEKVGGDYTFTGVVVTVFTKLSGLTRYVVEDDRGVLHIYSDKNLRAITKEQTSFKFEQVIEERQRMVDGLIKIRKAVENGEEWYKLDAATLHLIITEALGK